MAGAIRTVTPRSERRARTISRLLDATIESLVDVGFTATTVRGVAQRAGVSQGATTHHFPQRRDLIAAALDEIANRIVSAQRAKIPLLPREPDARRFAAIDLLREGITSPMFVAWVRLWVAATEDEELREIMRPVEKRLWQMAVLLCQDAFPEFADDPTFPVRLAVIYSLLRGLGLQNHFDPRRDERRRDRWSVYRASINVLLQADPDELALTTRPSRATGRRAEEDKPSPRSGN
jgi:AcrR family transcriptional regulator